MGSRIQCFCLFCVAFPVGGCAVTQAHGAREEWHIRIHPENAPAGLTHGHATVGYPHGVCGTLSGIKPPPPTDLDFSNGNVPIVVIPAGRGWSHRTHLFGVIPISTTRGGEQFFDLTIQTADGRTVYHAMAYDSPELSPSGSHQVEFEVFPWRDAKRDEPQRR